MGKVSFATFLQVTTEDHLRRMNSKLRGAGKALEAVITTEEEKGHFKLRIQTKDEKASLVIPQVRKNSFGNWVIGDQHDRVLCPIMVVFEGQPRYLSYEQWVAILLAGNLSEIFPEQGRKNHLDKLLWGFSQGRGRVATSLCQRFLNQKLFHALPLSSTSMRDWAMNRRLMIYDPIFGTLRPEEKLAYQRRKNELLHPWSSIGLSDGAAATENYILQADLKQYTAFGSKHHNPIRNLYSTLGMKGEESPWVVSESAAELEKQGVGREGWNWMTVFLDLPLNFEDQILVSRRHAGKTVTYNRSFVVFGEESVLPGDNILNGRVLGVNEDESPVVFDIDCDHAKVLSVENGVVPFDGQDQPVRLVSLEVVYSFKEGFKITNQHGNKGIVILENLGTVYDPVHGEVPIDVIVSAKSIQKRKNFGQVLEALATRINGPSKRLVVPDQVKVTSEEVEKKLLACGLPSDGTGKAKTPWGEFNSLCGWVHWGVIKTPEEQLWKSKDVQSTNQKGLRTRGNKISPIELKSLTTLLGPNSAVVREILSHRQGTGEVKELLQTLEVLRGNYSENLPVVNPETFIYTPAGLGTFYTNGQLLGTLSDEEMYPKGCYLQLPVTLRIQVPLERWKNGIVEGLTQNNAYEDTGNRVFETDKLLIPSYALRQPWQHPTGKFGLSEITTLLNQILEGIDRLKHGEIKDTQLAALIYKYLHHVGKSLSTKSGKISTYLMSVRYPWSSKATAVLGRDLEPNWVEIHKDMAEGLKVTDGDYVLVERFPCLGFMSTRIQRVKVTEDPEAKYVIRVSGNSLVSMNLDFDGDVIYIMSFHSDGAKAELERNFHEPHPRIKEVLDDFNSRKVPFTRSMNFKELELRSFESLNPQEHADLNSTSLAVKLYTGPVIALCYNLMRIAEGNFSYSDREAHINIEVFLDKVGNSVFSQKHGVKSLREESVEAVCLADVQALVNLGFPEAESRQLCAAIRKYAAKLKVTTEEQLREHYQKHLEKGTSNIVTSIVRKFHKAYFATRSNLHPIDLLEHLESSPNDLVSHLILDSLRN